MFRQYSVTTVDLTTADQRDLDLEGDYFAFLNAFGAGGVQNLDARVDVAIGKAVEDYIPATINTRLRGYAQSYRLKWAAQPGVTAYFYIARGPDVLETESPPVKQIVTSAIGAGITTGAVTIGTVAALIKAANAARQSLIVQNLGAADIYVGPAGVAVATGLKVAAGAALTLDKNAGAVYGISAAAGNDVRFAEEA